MPPHSARGRCRRAREYRLRTGPRRIDGSRALGEFRESGAHIVEAVDLSEPLSETSDRFEHRLSLCGPGVGPASCGRLWASPGRNAIATFGALTSQMARGRCRGADSVWEARPRPCPIRTSSTCQDRRLRGSRTFACRRAILGSRACADRVRRGAHWSGGCGSPGCA